MKAIFAVCLILVFASAQSLFTRAPTTFTPQWDSCEQQYQGWRTKNITMDSAPVAGKNSTFTICGESSWGSGRFTFVNVGSKYTPGFSLFEDDIYNGWLATGCYKVNSRIPEGQENVTLSIRSYSSNGDIGCVDVNLRLESPKSESKFASFLAFIKKLLVKLFNL